MDNLESANSHGDKESEKNVAVLDEEINNKVEEILTDNILTEENLQNENVEVTFEPEKEPNDFLIEYEFELEKEQRMAVSPDNDKVPAEWPNHVIDTYDQTGRCRIREKNGKPRLSIKVPLMSQDTADAKCCIRLEFKPVNESQKRDLLKIRELILQEEETKVFEKWGAQITLSNGEKVWINRDENDHYWIETDESKDIRGLLPKGINYLQHYKSKIDVKTGGIRKEEGKEILDEEKFEIFKKVMTDNLEATSRSAKGVSDTSVSTEKNKLLKEGEDLSEQIKTNQNHLVEYIWENKNIEINSEEDIENIIKNITDVVNDKLVSEPYKFRIWPVKYGRKVSPENIENEMNNFYLNAYTKLKEVEHDELNPNSYARWLEVEIDKSIHPFQDGCGRIAKAVSAFFLVRFNKPLPYYESREKYYAALNKSDEDFRAYYNNALDNSKMI